LQRFSASRRRCRRWPTGTGQCPEGEIEPLASGHWHTAIHLGHGQRRHNCLLRRPEYVGGSPGEWLQRARDRGFDRGRPLTATAAALLSSAVDGRRTATGREHLFISGMSGYCIGLGGRDQR